MKNKFGIKLKPFGQGDMWRIVYTNNNWITERIIYRLILINELPSHYSLFSKEEAVELCNRFSTYEEMQSFNDINLIEYNKAYEDWQKNKRELIMNIPPKREDKEIIIK